MSELTYGNKVVYITCNRDELNTIPVVDGQLITFYDANGMYYDMNSIRHQVGSSECVNELPPKGMSGVIYILLHSSNSSIKGGIYLWDDAAKSYVSAIPKVDSVPDAPDTKHWYLRIKGSWKHIDGAYFIDESDNVTTQFSKLQSFIDELDKDDTLKVIGNFHSSTTAKVLIGNCRVDFTHCNFSRFESGFSERDDETANWYYLKLSGFSEVCGVRCERVYIDMSFTDRRHIQITNCHLEDSKCVINSDGSIVRVHGNVFTCNNWGYIPIMFAPDTIKGSSGNIAYIQNNYFDFEDIMPGCAIATSENSSVVISNNYFGFAYVIGYKPSFSYTSQVKTHLYTPIIDDTTNQLRISIIKVYDSNEVNWLKGTMPIVFLEYVSQILEGPGNLFQTCDLILLDNNYVLGVAETYPKFCLEVNPGITTHVSEISDIESVTNSTCGVELRLADIGRIVGMCLLSVENIKKVMKYQPISPLCQAHDRSNPYQQLVYVKESSPSIKLKADSYSTTAKAFTCSTESQDVDSSSYKYFKFDTLDSSVTEMTGPVDDSLDCRFLLYM